MAHRPLKIWRCKYHLRCSTPFSKNGGFRVVTGNIGRGIIKISAVKPDHYLITAPARVFYDQNDVVAAFENGELEKDVMIILLGQGPNPMECQSSISSRLHLALYLKKVLMLAL